MSCRDLSEQPLDLLGHSSRRLTKVTCAYRALLSLCHQADSILDPEPRVPVEDGHTERADGGPCSTMRELPSNGSRNLWGTESVGEKRHAGGGCGPDNVRCRGGGVRLRVAQRGREPVIGCAHVAGSWRPERGVDEQAGGVGSGPHTKSPR